MADETVFSRKLKSFISTNHSSVEDFAEKYEFKPANVYKWQSGTKPSDPSIFIKLESIIKDIKLSNEEEEELKPNIREEPASYMTQRRNKKNNGGPVMVPLVPVKAQAGYAKHYSESDFIDSLELYPIVPGIDPHGSVWRYFEMEGDSMLKSLNSGDFVLGSQVHREEWDDLKDTLIYVIVTESLVTIKRVMKRKKTGEFILIPENDAYEQRAVKASEIKEIWKYRRHIGWNVSSPKKFEIKI